MNKEQYVKQVAKHLVCKKDRRNEIMQQLSSDIESALEQGEDWESIEARLGTPSEMAAEFNESFADRSPANISSLSRRKTAGIIIGAFVLLCLILISVLPHRSTGTDSSVTATSSPAAGSWPISDEEAATLAGSVLDNYTDGNYADIIKVCDDKLKSELTQPVLSQTREDYLKNAGSYQSTKNTAITHTKSGNVRYTVVQLLTAYEKQQVVFTITFDEKKQLSGFYIQ